MNRAEHGRAQRSAAVHVVGRMYEEHSEQGDAPQHIEQHNALPTRG
jgi:hypothetical protein